MLQIQMSRNLRSFATYNPMWQNSALRSGQEGERVPIFCSCCGKEAVGFACDGKVFITKRIHGVEHQVVFKLYVPAESAAQPANLTKRLPT